MSSAPGAAGAAAAARVSPPVDSGRSTQNHPSHARVNVGEPFPLQRKGKEGVIISLQLCTANVRQSV